MKRFVAIATLFILVLLHASPATAGGYAVKSAIVMDMGTGQILFEQNADKRIAPASLTKVLTMYLVWEDVEQGRVKLDDNVTISKASAKTGGSSMKLVAGETVTVSELMRGMAIASGNDACVAIAEYIGGGKAEFVERMNRKAKFLGMDHTTFKNPHGLPAKGQLTTARDMMRLAYAYLRRFPESLELHSKTHMYHRKIKRRNSNKLLGKVPGVDGLKTGYVAASGFNIIVTAKRNGRRLLMVVLGGKTSAIRNREAKKLLEASFDTLPVQQQTPKVQLAKAPDKSPQPVANAKLSPRRNAIVDAAVDHAASMAMSASKGPSLRNAAYDVAAPTLQGSYSHPLFSLHESSWRTGSKARQRAKALQRRGVQNVRSQEVDLGSKGIWYRVYIGNFDSMRQAKAYKDRLSRTMSMRHAVIMELGS